jgi:signal transduction histidine kinase
MPLLVCCVFTCQYYLHSWIVGAGTCAIGIVLSSWFMMANDYIVSRLSFTNCIGEQAIFVVIFIWAYVGFAFTSYFAEYKDRFTFYKNLRVTQVLIAFTEQEKKQWEQLLDNLPLGLVVLNEGNVAFSNQECSHIFSTPIPTFKDFAAMKTLDAQTTLGDLMKSPERLAEGGKQQFVYQKSDSKLTFTIRHAEIPFLSQHDRAVILQDQSVFEELKNLSERCQRLYSASVVHDIRNPLNGIVGMLEMLDHSVKDEEGRAYLAVARSSTTLMLYLTYDITDYSQFEAGRVKVREDDFSPEEAVDSCVQLLNFNFKMKGVLLLKKVVGCVPRRVKSDNNRYMQILLNLLSNALKFTYRGQVIIVLSYAPDKDILTTSVEDTGIGIKETDLPCLFRLFGQVQESSALNPTGIGFGLTICKKLTELLGGGITVDSQHGRGSAFTFTIKGNVRSGEWIHEKSMCNLNSDDSKEREDDSSGSNAYEFSRLIRDNPMHRARTSSRVRIWLTVQQRTYETRCQCPKLLFVDDNVCNLFVLQCYAKLLRLTADSVLLSFNPL